MAQQNPDILEERGKATFPIQEVTKIIYGSDKVVRERSMVLNLVESVSDFQDVKPPEFMTRAERYENAARKVAAIRRYVSRLDGMEIESAYLFQRLVLRHENATTNLHYDMFIPALEGQATDEQKARWLPLAYSLAIIGTYAQTELGHGTQLRFLETTATYDVKTQEFILHTPSITAYKWWPGNLGKSSNYAVVQAQLVVQGRRHGPHIFIVQLRHLDTHQPLKGVKLGDIGPKFGFHSNDNGYLALDNYRIPRDQMLMRFAKVLPDGTYVRPSHAKLSYGGMVTVRSFMCQQQATFLAMAATIGIRYSAVRRQGEITQGAGEVKIIDYQTQQYRVVPEMAKAFAYFFAGRNLRHVYQTVAKQLLAGDASGLPELHALSSGLKAVVTWEAAQGIEQCRLACGGHGYNLASGLPQLYVMQVAGCTYEGDNIVLLLQVARSLVKIVRGVRSGNSSVGSSPLTQYLTRTAAVRSPLTAALELEHLLVAFEHVARKRAFACVDALDRLAGLGVSPENAWNQCGIQLCKAARAHTRVFVVRNFITTLASMQAQSVRDVLTAVCRLFVYTTLERRAGHFLIDGYMSDAQVTFVRLGVREMLWALRDNLVALTDVWDFSDRELNSVLGRYDGNVYPNMLEWVKHSNLNQKQVLDSHDKYIGPLMKDARSKL